MTDNLSLSDKEYLILQLLINSATEQYGLQLVNDSDGQLKKGTIYVTLGRLEDKGYIESRKETAKPGERGLPKRLYQVTGEGRRAFDFQRQVRNLQETFVSGGSYDFQ